MNIVIYFLFNGAIFLIGRGSAVFIKKIFNKNTIVLDRIQIFNLDIFYIYSLFGLFVIGNISFIGNFFVSLDNLIFKVLFLVLIFVNFYEKFIIKNIKFFLINVLVIPLMLFFSSYSVNLAQDAGLYQLNSQLWIKSSKIIFGLSNLHSRYGYSSISEYIGANFWLDDNLIILHFVSLIFISFFFTFLINNVYLVDNKFLKFTSLSIIMMGIIDNFGFGGGRNGFIDIDAVMKQDTAFAILFFFGSLSIFNLILTEDFSLLNIVAISLVILFSIQFRIFGFVMLFIFLYYLYLSHSNGILIRDIFKCLSPAFLILVAWTIKNIIVSGCMIFPVELTCFDSLPWYYNGYAYEESYDLNIFHIAYGLGDNVFLWLQNWIQKPTNVNTVKNFLITFLLILIFKKSYFKKELKSNYRTSYLVIYSYVSLSFLLWVISAPSTRFAIGLFLVSISLIFLNIDSFNERFFIPSMLLNFSIAFLVFICIFTLNRLENYQVFINNPLIQRELTPTLVSYKSNAKGWGVTPIEGSSCWINTECIPEEKKLNLQEGFYKTFFIDG